MLHRSEASAFSSGDAHGPIRNRTMPEPTVTTPKQHLHNA